jgi:zinc transport system substrate-binding protein
MLKMLPAATAVSFVALVLSSAGLAGAGAAADAPRVIVSIKPVHSLVAGVMDGIGDPELLIEGGGSPHTYSLRPSEAQALQEADVVFWIGEELEGFLARPLQTLPRAATLVALHQAEGVRLLDAREGGGWEAHAHDPEPEHAPQQEHGHAHEHEHEHEHGHGHGNADMHIWLDPVNAQAMVASIATTLSTLDPPNEQHYASNAAGLLQQLADLDTRLREQLGPVENVPYIVFHDAYQYFEDRYNLNAVGSITVTPEQQPGAQRLYDIRARIAETGVACVFSEPQFQPSLVETVIEGTQARAGVLDPLGAELAPGPEAYFELMDQLAAALRGCLEGAG